MVALTKNGSLVAASFPFFRGMVGLSPDGTEIAYRGTPPRAVGRKGEVDGHSVRITAERRSEISVGMVVLTIEAAD